MLVDLPEDWKYAASDEIIASLVKLTGGVYGGERLATGVYLSHINFGHEILPLVLNEYPFSDYMRTVMDEEHAKTKADENYVSRFVERVYDLPSDYGVCDNYYQILGRWYEMLVESPRRFLISVSAIEKSNQPSQGGWRWHKWGEYIGYKDPQHEHLYDEGPEITKVFCFQIFEMKD